MKKLSLLGLMALLMFSCEKDDEQEVQNSPAPDNRVQFETLKIGQTSQYQRYRKNCFDPSSQYELSGDTIILEVIEHNDSLYLKESFSPGSTELGGMLPVQYPIIDREGYVLLPQRLTSNLFFFYGNDTIWTKPAHDVELVQNNCLITMDNGDPFIGIEIGHIQNFDVDVLSKTDRTAVSCVPGFTVDAYLIYDERGLEVSHVFNTSMLMPMVHGWSRIE